MLPQGMCRVKLGYHVMLSRAAVKSDLEDLSTLKVKKA